MDYLNFLFLEADDDIGNEETIDNGMAENEDTESEENTEENTKQNNNEEESDDETDEIDGLNGNVDSTGSNPDNDTENMDDDEQFEEDELSKSKRLFFYNNFESLFNVTLNFIDKLEYIREKESDEKNKIILVELENKLLKQKNDINFLLKKKIMVTSEENLNKLLLYFSTKTETIIDITKSLVKNVDRN